MLSKLLQWSLWTYAIIGKIFKFKFICPYISVVERQSCKPKVCNSILRWGKLKYCYKFIQLGLCFFSKLQWVTFYPHQKVLSLFLILDIFRESNIEEWQEVMHITTPPLNIVNYYLVQLYCCYKFIHIGLEVLVYQIL